MGPGLAPPCAPSFGMDALGWLGTCYMADSLGFDPGSDGGVSCHARAVSASSQMASSEWKVEGGKERLEIRSKGKSAGRVSNLISCPSPTKWARLRCAILAVLLAGLHVHVRCTEICTSTFRLYVYTVLYLALKSVLDRYS